MTFTRTPAGLSNLYLFHGVDAVVFIEGGTRSYSYDQVLQGQAGITSDDIPYWRTIFGHMAHNIKVTFKPVGSKGTLNKIAYLIAAKQVSQVFVAMDQDLDRFTGQQIHSDGVFYTCGYSWENDLFCDAILKDAVFSLCPIDPTAYEAEVTADISKDLKKFEEDARWFVKADILLCLCATGLFDRTDCRNSIKRSGGGRYTKPFLQTTHLRRQVRQINDSKGNNRYNAPSTRIHTVRDCFGHLLGLFLFHYFVYLLHKYHGDPSISKKNAFAVLISMLEKNLTEPTLSELRRHHDTQFAFLQTCTS